MFHLWPKYSYFAGFGCLAGDILRYKIKIRMKLIFTCSITSCDGLPGSCHLQLFFTLLRDLVLKDTFLATSRGLGPIFVKGSRILVQSFGRLNIKLVLLRSSSKSCFQ